MNDLSVGSAKLATEGVKCLAAILDCFASEVIKQAQGTFCGTVSPDVTLCG